MNNISISNYNNPLARGYIHDAEMNLLLDFQSMELIGCKDQLGINLLDFVWFDELLLGDILSLLCQKYLMGCSADGLIEFIRPLAESNCYLLLYITYAIELLIDGKIDNRFDEDIDISLLETLTDTYTIDDIKMLIIKQIPQVIIQKQKWVQSAIDLILSEDSKYKNFTPSQRLYLVGRNDNTNLSTSFNTSFGSTVDLRELSEDKITEKIKKENIPFFEMFQLDMIDDIIRFELVQMISHNCIIKKCKLCGKLFTPKGRIDSLFCSRIMEGEERPCIDIGPSRLQTNEINTNPIRKAYKQAYDRMSSRKRYGTIPTQEFQSWQLEAGMRRDKCLSGEMELEDYQAWLDESKYN